MSRTGWRQSSVSRGVHRQWGPAGKEGDAGKNSCGSLWQGLTRAGKTSLGGREWPSQEKWDCERQPVPWRNTLGNEPGGLGGGVGSVPSRPVTGC